MSTMCNVQARREQNQGNGRWGGKTHGTRYGKVTNVMDGEAGRVKRKLPSPHKAAILGWLRPEISLPFSTLPLTTKWTGPPLLVQATQVSLHFCQLCDPP